MRHVEQHDKALAERTLKDELDQPSLFLDWANDNVDDDQTGLDSGFNYFMPVNLTSFSQIKISCSVVVFTTRKHSINICQISS